MHIFFFTPRYFLIPTPQSLSCNPPVTAICQSNSVTEKTLPNISSFVIRFVVEPAPEQVEPQPSYRGAIRHIQTDEELTFCRWGDVEDFIRRFVPLETTERGAA